MRLIFYILNAYDERQIRHKLVIIFVALIDTPVMCFMFFKIFFEILYRLFNFRRIIDISCFCQFNKIKILFESISYGNLHKNLPEKHKQAQ